MEFMYLHKLQFWVLKVKHQSFLNLEIQDKWDSLR